MISDNDEEETFTQEVERMAQERLAALTAEDEDADLKLALATLMKVVERPPRAPRGTNDVWGWSVGNEHALQPGTETRQEVIKRIKRSYGAEPGSIPQNRDQKEKGVLETIAAQLESIKDNPGFASHDLKRIVKVLGTVISDRMGPGDDPSGKSSKYLLLPGTKTAAQIALEIATPVPEPTVGSKDYVQARSNTDPNFIELEQRYGKSQVYIELQRIKLGMMPLNEDIAEALAKIAEKADREAKLVRQSAIAKGQQPLHPPPGDAKQRFGDASSTDQYSRTAGGNQTSIHKRTEIIDEAQAGIAELGTPVETHIRKTPSTAFVAGPYGDFSRDNEHQDPIDGIKIKCNVKGFASIKAEHFSYTYTYREILSDQRGHPKGVIEIAEEENSAFYPFTLDYIRFIREAEKIYKEKKALSDVRVEADKHGSLSRMRLRWKDHAESAPYRMAGWEFHRWFKQMDREIERMRGKPDWERLEELKNWTDWGKEPPDYEPHGPS